MGVKRAFFLFIVVGLHLPVDATGVKFREDGGSIYRLYVLTYSRDEVQILLQHVVFCNRQ